MDRNKDQQTPLQNGQMFKNEQDPIFRGEISKINFDEASIGTPDSQPQTVNLVSSSLLSPLAPRKRKRSDSPEYEQDHRVPKKRFFEDGYPNTSMGTRWLFVFNYSTFTNPEYPERKGSELDVQSLESTFSKLGYEIVHNEDLSYEETFNQLKKIQELCNDGGIHTIVLALMSHGDERDPDNFLTSDDKIVSMSQVHNLFSNGSCEGLRGKPKLFLGIFCCNKANHKGVLPSSPAIGSEWSQSFEYDETEHDLESEKVLQMVTGSVDCINNRNVKLSLLIGADNNTSMMETDSGKICDSPWVLKPDDLTDTTTIYASKPGTASYRDPRKGTVFVQCLCRVIDKYGQTYPLNDLYRFLQQDMKSEQTGASSEYSFSPDRDDLELKTLFFADP